MMFAEPTIKGFASGSTVDYNSYSEATFIDFTYKCLMLNV